MRAGYLREAVALLERAQQTEDPREASELVKQAADMLALVAELSASDNPRSASTNATELSPDRRGQRISNCVK